MKIVDHSLVEVSPDPLELVQHFEALLHRTGHLLAELTAAQLAPLPVLVPNVSEALVERALHVGQRLVSGDRVSPALVGPSKTFGVTL